MKTKAGIEKPLAEWTVQEVKDFCKHNLSCNDDGCQLLGICGATDVSVWDLSEKPKFTDAEKCDAAHLIHIFGNRHITVSRNDKGETYVVAHLNTGSGNGLFISRDLFPSIKSGDKFSVSEILGDADA